MKSVEAPPNIGPRIGMNSSGPHSTATRGAVMQGDVEATQRTCKQHSVGH